MAVLKKIRSRWLSAAPPTPPPPPAAAATDYLSPTNNVVPLVTDQRYDIRPLSISQLDECWKLDQRCFVDGEAYSRDTFEYLLTAPEAVSYRVVTPNGSMVGFVIGLIEPDHTGHITTVGIAPDHRRRHLARRLMLRAEEGFRRRNVRIVRLEVRSLNVSAQQLYLSLGYTVTQRLPKYYSNGGDGLLMVRSLD